jgi:hypothetical protein
LELEIVKFFMAPPRVKSATSQSSTLKTLTIQSFSVFL